MLHEAESALHMQASAGLGYANVKMMQYDVKHSGENKMMDAVEIVKCAPHSPFVFPCQA